MLQCKLLLDWVDIIAYSRLTPSNGFMSRYIPNSVARTIKLHPETISLYNNWRADNLKEALKKGVSDAKIWHQRTRELVK